MDAMSVYMVVCPTLHHSSGEVGLGLLQRRRCVGIRRS